MTSQTPCHKSIFRNDTTANNAIEAQGYIDIGIFSQKLETYQWYKLSADVAIKHAELPSDPRLHKRLWSCESRDSLLIETWEVGLNRLNRLNKWNTCTGTCNLWHCIRNHQTVSSNWWLTGQMVWNMWPSMSKWDTFRQKWKLRFWFHHVRHIPRIKMTPRWPPQSSRFRSYGRSNVAWHWQNSSSSLRLIFFIVNLACKFKTP